MRIVAEYPGARACYGPARNRGETAATAATLIRTLAFGAVNPAAEVPGGRSGQRTVAEQFCTRHHSRFDYPVAPNDRKDVLAPLERCVSAMAAAFEAEALHTTDGHTPQPLEGIGHTEEEATAHQSLSAPLEDEVVGCRNGVKTQTCGLGARPYCKWNALPAAQQTSLTALVTARTADLARSTGNPGERGTS